MNLEWENWKDDKKRRYGVTQSPEETKESSKGIRIIGESTDEDKYFLKAQKLIRNAENIYFIGIGYHEDNLNRLKLKKMVNEGILNKKVVKGTIFGLSGSENRFINNYFINNGKYVFRGYDVKSLQFLKDEVDLE